MARRKLPTPTPPRFKVGDWAVHVIGPTRFPVRILEDVGPVGWSGVRYYRYVQPDLYADPVESEAREESLEPARPDEVATAQAALARAG